MRQPNFDEMTREELIAYARAQQEEGIRITFDGKSNAKKIARLVRPRTMRSVPELSTGEQAGRANNILIEGENLQSMVTLYKERGQVDLILTDPPYNTGNDFRYNDRWDEDPNDSGLGDFVGPDDVGRHTKWMRFMWPRLKVMKSMLKPGGVLAICIDHRELFRLGQMLDELFDERNRLAIINWQKTAAPRPDKEHVSTSTEYVLVYAKDEARAKSNYLARPVEMNRRYSNPDGDLEGDWREGNLTARTPSYENEYAIQSPFTGQFHYPAGGGAWRHPKRNVKAWLEQWGSQYEERDLGDGRAAALAFVGSTTDASAAASKALEAGPWPFLWFGRDGQGRPRVKTYLERIRKGVVPVTYWADEDYEETIALGSTSWDYEQSGRSSEGASELTAIVGPGHGFQTVKPLKLFSKILNLWCPPGGLVVDPFAGSGTTGHAVLLSNAGGTSRNFILVEQGRPERGDAYARSLTAERLRRVVTGEWASGPHEPLGGGYTFWQTQEQVDAAALLTMERDEMTDTVIASHRGGSDNTLIRVDNSDYRYLVGRNVLDEGFFLVWSGTSTPPVFDEQVYADVVAEAEREGLKQVFHVYARFNLFQSDDVRFYQIPDQILYDFGLSPNDPYYNRAGDE